MSSPLVYGILRWELTIGGRAVNYMALARGPAADYDEWAKIVGDDGWKWDRILPLMKNVRILEGRSPVKHIDRRE